MRLHWAIMVCGEFLCSDTELFKMSSLGFVRSLQVDIYINSLGLSCPLLHVP